MKKISLRSFLIIILTFFSISFLAFFILLINNSVKTFNQMNYEKDFKKSYLLWGETQWAQYDFLFNYKNDNVFFQTEQNKYLKRQQIYSSNTKLVLDSLLSLNITTRYKLTDDINLIVDNLNQIENNFNQLSHTLFLRGSQKTGLIGNTFSFYQLASSSVSEQQVQIYLKNMNAIFLNYITTPNFEYYQEFLKNFTLLVSYIKKNAAVTPDTSIAADSIQAANSSDIFSPQFINNINEYKRSFNKLVDLDRNLMLNEQANLMTQWQNFHTNVGNSYTNILSIIQEKLVIVRKKLQLQILIFLIFLTLLLASMNLLLPRLIAKRLSNFNDFIEPLRVGKLPENNIEIKAFSELVEINSTIDKVITSLNDASEFANEIGKGNFISKFSPISDQDKLGNALILLRDNLQKAQKEEEKRKKADNVREWFNTGIANFSDILRQSAKKTSELSTLVIKDLVNYLKANQGGIFIINTENNKTIIELVASYAYSKERKKKKEFLLGEGLIGTCAVEKATIYMTEIPEDYISITSGLGKANPRSLLIVPLNFEDQILGVIEIASFNEFEKYQIEFVERVAESIASTISISKINERTVKLLANAKIEAEQRSLKEEELRQNLEELQATQERATQREYELSNLLNLINKVAYVLELDIDGNIISSPDILAKNLKLQNNDVIGHHISEFDYNSNSKLIDPKFWQELLDSEGQKYQLKYLRDENISWLDSYIVPFVNNEGEVLKYVCVIVDTTEQQQMQEELLSRTNELQIKEQIVLKNIKELRGANEKALKEKQTAEALTKKMKVSEDVLRKAITKNKSQITKIRELAQKASEQNNQFRLLFGNSSDAIIEMYDNKFIDCNHATIKKFGFATVDDFAGTTMTDISPPTQSDGMDSGRKAELFFSVAAKEGFNSFSWIHKKIDDSEFPAKVSVISYFRDDKKYFYLLIQDKTNADF